MIALLKLRRNQAYRIIREVGLLLILVALFACASFIFSIFVGLRDSSPIDFIYLGGMIIGAVDFFRRDKHFLLLLFGSRMKVKRYLSIEYLLITLPLILGLLARGEWLYSLLYVLSMSLFSFLLPFKLRFIKGVYKKEWSFIPLTYFEVKCFAEQRKVQVILIVILLFAGIFHISAWILGMVFLTAALTEIFKYLEPRMMLPSSFQQRLWDYFIFFQGLLLIPIVCNLIAYPQYGLVYLYAWLSFGVAVILLISYKYNAYNGITSQLFSSNLPGIFVLLSLLPGFVIVTVGLAFYYFIKAKKNMRYVGA